MTEHFEKLAAISLRCVKEKFGQEYHDRLSEIRERSVEDLELDEHEIELVNEVYPDCKARSYTPPELR